MKKFENNYKKLMDKVELSKTEKESIKNNIILKKDKFVVKKLLVTISAVVIIFTISMTVNALINHYTIIKNDEYNKKTSYPQKKNLEELSKELISKAKKTGKKLTGEELKLVKDYIRNVEEGKEFIIYKKENGAGAASPINRVVKIYFDKSGKIKKELESK